MSFYYFSTLCPYWSDWKKNQYYSHVYLLCPIFCAFPISLPYHQSMSNDRILFILVKWDYWCLEYLAVFSVKKKWNRDEVIVQQVSMWFWSPATHMGPQHHQEWLLREETGVIPDITRHDPKINKQKKKKWRKSINVLLCVVVTMHS